MATVTPALCSRRVKITHDKTKISSDLNSFPVLLTKNVIGTEDNIPDEPLTTGDANAARSDGGDVCFAYDAAGTQQIPCEIVLWTQNATPANQKAIIWVKLDASSSNDTEFYMFYGYADGAQPAVDATYGAQAVWSSYAEVWHMGAAATADASSKKTNAATWGGSGTARDTSGAFGNATAFNGSGYADAASFDGYDNTEDHTFSFFAKMANATGCALVQSMPASGGTAGDGLGSSLGNNNKMQLYAKGGLVAWGTDQLLTQSEWVHAAAVVTGGASAATLKFFRNGSGSTTFTQYSGTLAWVANNSLTIGAFTTHDYKATASIQEIRVRGAASADAWVTAEYTSMTDTAFIKSVGTPESNLSSSNVYIILW